MATIRKDAGEARERPRPTTRVHAEPGAAAPSARPAGGAPVFDAATSQLTPRAGEHKGMASNPWVKHWAGVAPPPSTGVAGAPAQPDLDALPAPEEEPARQAGPAPKQPRRRKS
jgi:hypothetical protein